MEREPLTQALIVVVLANVAVIGLALASFVRWRRSDGARPARAVGPGQADEHPATQRDDLDIVEADPDPPGQDGTDVDSEGPPLQSPEIDAALRRTNPDNRAAGERAGDRRRPAVDPQTGLPSGGMWAIWLDRHEAAFARYGRDMTIVVIELEGIDGLAERLGDEAADGLVNAYASFLRAQCRTADLLARTEWARFSAILPETSETQAESFVGRVRELSQDWLAGGALDLRPAIGYASPTAGGTLGEAVRVATELLYAERRRSRRRGARPLEGPGARPEGIQG